MYICKYVGPGKLYIKEGVAANQEDADVFNADALAADNADVLAADKADVLAADTTDVLAADNKEAPVPFTGEKCYPLRAKK